MLRYYERPRGLELQLRPLVLTHETNNKDALAVLTDSATTRNLSRRQPGVRNRDNSKAPRMMFPPANPNRQGQGGLRLEGLFNRSSLEKPLISVVTVVFNGAAYLEQTIGSVINQTYDNIEYIIIDGASTDRTREIIQKYDAYVSYWLSEPDQGIADAMNKGIQLAVGEYVLMLHADDYLLARDTIENAVQHLLEQPLIAAYCLYHEHDGARQLARPKPWNWRMNLKFSLLHQAVMCHRKLFEQIGLFDTNFKIDMDYDFFLRAYRQGIKVKCIQIPLSVMRRTGISSRVDKASLRRRFLEEKAVHKKNASGMWQHLMYAAYWLAYPLYRRCN